MTTPAAGLPFFHDAHAHAVEAQAGGFLIALEGAPRLAYALDNAAVLAAHDPRRLLIGVPYARAGGEDSGLPGPVMKYHARREGFPPEWVARDIARYGRKVVLLDTLNAIDWPPRAYLDIARGLPGVQFVMCHSGGYDILEFVKMGRFVPNVWLDFSATQQIFGWTAGAPTLNHVTDCIRHAYGEPRIARRLMFGSDNPEFDQAGAVVRLAASVDDPEPFLRTNFERLVSETGLV